MRKQSGTVDISLLMLRFVFGLIFVLHGSQKLFGAFGGSGIVGFSQMLEGLNVFFPLFFAWIVTMVEFLGGILLILGITPRISAGLIAINMLVAMYLVHLPKGFFMSEGGIEFTLILFAVALFIVMVGSGRFSIWNKW